MFVFELSGTTARGNFYCALLFFLIVLIYWKRCTSPAGLAIKAEGGGLLSFLVVFFAVTACYTGDFFGYQSLVDSYLPGMDSFHLEKVYEYIITYTKCSYPLFRIVVWGGAVLCFVLTAKLLKVNLTVSLFIMFLLFTTPFCYARASLAMAIFFFGLSLWMHGRRNKKIHIVLLGIAILLCSYLFHKSILVLIILTASCFLPINKKTILPILIIIGLLGFAVDNMVDSFLDLALGLGDDQLTEKIEYGREMFEGRQDIKATLFGWIFLLWQYIPFYLTFIIVSIEMLKKERQASIMADIYRITFAIIMLATLLLVFGSHSYTYFYRYLFMSYIPLSILTVYLYTNGYMSKSKYSTIIYVCGGYNLCYFLTYLLFL